MNQNFEFDDLTNFFSKGKANDLLNHKEIEASLFNQYLLDLYNCLPEDSRLKTKAHQIERYKYSTIFPYETITAYRILAEPENNYDAIINMLVDDLRE